MNTFLIFFALFYKVSCLNPIIIVGNKFVDSVTKDLFYIRGVAYQPRNKDPLADPFGCKRDFQLMRNLGMNSVRVYEVNNTADHDICMQYMYEYGLYLILDLSTPRYSINRNSPEWTTSLFKEYKKTVDAFSKYPHTLAFFAGNEIVNDPDTSRSAPFVKAAIRDLKSYLKTKSRYIPVGYATSDDVRIRDRMAQFLICGELDTQTDFYGINMYEWCGQSSYVESGYAERTNAFRNYKIPVFLSEYGCNQPRPRLFTEVLSIYGPEMSNVFSGGIVYEWTEEENNYGLVKIDGHSIRLLPDYTALKQQLASVPAIPTSLISNINGSSESVQCPIQDKNWQASFQLPPTPSDENCKCMTETLGCIYDLDRDVGSTLDMVCGITECEDISVNGTGRYGKWSYCSDKQRISFELDKLSKLSGECGFGGRQVKPLRNLEECNSNVISRSGTSSVKDKSVSSGRIAKYLVKRNQKSNLSWEFEYWQLWLPLLLYLVLF
ncbi:uncharacterized protein VTP21DRAFT_6323 [Calcarisporiella thermophila]|uniref:uncharacterized protein n=1 Tax=Calcarisporiella thermophila TaxID=911321 RepID=UPI00374424F5